MTKHECRTTKEWSDWGERHGRKRRKVAVEYRGWRTFIPICSTRCYGSLTTFNILFKNKDDQFRTGR